MSTPESEAPATPAVDRLGLLISGRYLIRQLLGEGGMGSVYLAEHTHMKKHVALKLLHPEVSGDPEVSARFEREAMAAAHIQHPNVAAATDFGKAEDGTLFLVLEYVEGTSLREALNLGPIDVGRCMRITRQIALALERAHEVGIVHRDLKPDNVMLMRKEHELDFVKVLDFGIAKLVEGAASASAEIARRNGGNTVPLTRLGTILGTPEYMAPEQALGEPVTTSADLYGVGVILYEMLTGKHPFDPPDRMAMLSFHIVAPVPPMRERAPEREVPPLVEAVARCLLEKDSNKRYPNARALITAIDAACAASRIDVTGLKETRSDRPANEVDETSGEPKPAGYELARISPGAQPVVPLRTPGIGFLRTLAQPPYRLRYAVAGLLLICVPLGAVIFVTLLRPRFSGRNSSGSAVAEGDRDAEANARRMAPSDRVSAATALGPAGLEALLKEFPDDDSLRAKLPVAYSASGHYAEAVRAVRSLLTTHPGIARDTDVVRTVATIASEGRGEEADDAYALLEGPLGPRGVDFLIEFVAKGQSKDSRDLRARASKSIGKEEVRAHASTAALVLLDMRSASVCSSKRELLPRARESGDARLVPLLKPLKATGGCGFRGRRDCWPCLRKDNALDEAVIAAEGRPSPK